MKRITRLTESDLHRIVKESVKRAIRESYPYMDVEDIINKIPSLSDEKLEKIINGYYDPSYFESEYSDGFSEYEDVIEAARNEYAVRNKDFANNLFTKMNKPSYPKYYPSKHSHNALDDKYWQDKEVQDAVSKYPSIFNKNGSIRTRKDKSVMDVINKGIYGTDQTDKRPLHRKGSLNRAMEEAIRKTVNKILREGYFNKNVPNDSLFFP